MAKKSISKSKHGKRRSLKFFGAAFVIFLGAVILFSGFLWGNAQAKYEKTEKIGKVVADSMPQGVSLKWDDPAGFDKVVVVRNTDHLPIGSSDGKIIYQGKGKSFVDSDIEPATTYYYAVIFKPEQKTYLKRATDSLAKPVEIFQEVPAPVKTTVISTSVGSQFFLLLGMFDSIKDFWWTVFRMAQALFIFLGLRSSKKNSWGIVYDWETKEPLKNVVLNLKNERKEKVAATVSDEAGRFGFLVGEGNYFLEVGRYGNYDYKPELYDEEDIYGKVYRGKLLSTQKEELLKLNAPLFKNIPAEKKSRRIWKYVRLDFARLKSSKVVSLLTELFFWMGFLFILLSLLASFSLLKVFLLVFYLLVFLLRLYLFGVIKDWGLVLSNSNKNPVPFAVVRAFYSGRQEEEQAAVSVSNTQGGFYLLVPRDTYKITIKGRTLGGENFDKETTVFAKKGLINGVYYI